MAAGLGFKTFTTGEVLTAADTNGYLMQGVLVFASAAARDAAITSPQEGQCCYLKDTDAVLTYSGAAWVGFDDSNAIQNTIVDAKGDLITATAADTPARLAVGTNGQTLVADSTASTGLKWETPSSGGMTSIASGSLTGTSVVLSSIAATYKNLQLILRDVFITGTGAPRIKLNSVSNYNMLRYVSTSGTIAADALTGNGTFGLGYNNMKTSDNNSCFVVNIYDYTNSVAKEINALISYQNSGSAEDFMNYNGNAVMSAAVTSITIDGVTFAGGTYELFGVK